MRETTNALNALAKHESTEERAKFIGSFISDVNKDVKAALDKSDKTSVDAKSLVDKVKGNLKNAATSDSNKGTQ